MKRRYNFTINTEYQGYTVEDFLHHHIPQFSTTNIRKFIYDGFVKINDFPAQIHQQLQANDEILMLLPKQSKQVVQKAGVKIEVLYEDDGFLVVNKPPLIPVIPERWSRENLFRDSIRAHLKNDKIIPRVVHRIDKEASGAVIVAKNKEFERYFSGLFAKREIKKRYLTIVAGTPDASGTIQLPIKQVSSKSTRMMIHEEGKEATTHFTVVEFFRDFALLEVDIESGRTHQIRVHLASRGTPLAIDSLYGYRNSMKLSDLKSSYQHKSERIEKPLISRLTLHAHQLEFFHPGKQEKIQVTAPLFKDFEVFLKKLRKYRS